MVGKILIECRENERASVEVHLEHIGPGDKPYLMHILAHALEMEDLEILGFAASEMNFRKEHNREDTANES